MLNTITFIQKNRFEEDGQESISYQTSLPLEILEALKQRKFLPQTPYLHWRRIARLYYVVTLGDKCAECEYIWSLNNAYLPKHVVQEIKIEEQRSGLEANAIIWTIKRWHGRTVALAKILLGYDTNIPVEISYENITLTPEIRYYMQLKARTILYWKQIGDEGWIITKSTEDYDARSWVTCETLTIPKKFQTVHHCTFLTANIALKEKDGKPALVLTRSALRDPLDEFLDNTIEKGKGELEIHDLHTQYIAYVEKKKINPLLKYDFEHFINELERKRVVSKRQKEGILQKTNEPYYIHGFSLKTQTLERGENNG